MGYQVGTKVIEVGQVYACDKCANFVLTVRGLPSLLICIDHFGAHISGNSKVMARTLAVSEV